MGCINPSPFVYDNVSCMAKVYNLGFEGFLWNNVSK